MNRNSFVLNEIFIAQESSGGGSLNIDTHLMQRRHGGAGIASKVLSVCSFKTVIKARNIIKYNESLDSKTVVYLPSF